jgi:protein tyrosine phosphatase
MTETSKRRCVSAAAQAQGGGGGRGSAGASDAWRRAAESLAARRDAAAREFGAVAARDAAVAAPHSFSESVSRRAHGRNRYRDVLPYDSNRVRLPPSATGGAAAAAGGGSGSGSGGSGTSSCGPTTAAAAAASDYINASHVEVRLHVPDTASQGVGGSQKQDEDDDPLVTAALAAVPPATPPPGAAASSAAAVARYVATQGPLPSTCGDFWAMVASLGSPAVVMLTNAVERGVCKCHPYFPEEAAAVEGEEADGGSQQGAAGKAAAAKAARGQRGGSSSSSMSIGGAPTAELHLPSRGLSVRCVRVSRGIPPEAAWAGIGGGGGSGDDDSGDDIVVRRLQLRCASSGAVLHELDHYHLRAWPDHGVPQGPEGAAPVRALCRALELSRQQRRRLQEGPATAAEPPVVVHCSAGIGRTGTFCAVDVLLRRMWALSGGGSSCLAEEEKHGEEEGAAVATAGRPPPPQLTFSPLLLDVPSLVVALRAQRAGMVQTLEQYSYISEAALEEAGALAEGRAAPPGGGGGV